MSTELSHGRKQGVLFLLAITVIVVVMDLTILNVALDSIQRGLGASNAGLQWALDAFLITFSAFLFTGGVFADRYGRKRTLIVGLLIFGVGSVLAAYSTSIVELIIFRALMGVGAAAVPTITLAIIVSVFPPPERPRAIGIWAAAAGLAFAVGPVVGGLLLNAFWWGSVFLVNAPLVVIGVVLIAILVPESKSPLDNKFDPLGVVLSIVAVGALVYGIVQGGEQDKWLAPGTIGPIIGGIVLLIVLFAVEGRMAMPSVDVSLMRNSRFAAGTSVIALAFFGLLGAIFITTFYYQSALGFSPLKAGLLMLPMGIGTVITSSRSAKLAARFGPKRVVASGATLMAVSFALISVFNQSTALWLLVLAQVIFGLGWGCIMAPATASLMSVVPLPKAAAGQAISQTARQAAGALGVAVIGSILGVVYRGSIGSAVDVLPAGLRDTAAGSIGGTVSAIQSAHLTGQAPAQLLARGVTAFLSGMQVTMLVAAAVALVGALVALRWLPARLAPPGPPPVPAAAPAAPQSADVKPVAG